MVEASGMHLWIGADDIGREGTFRFLNGTKLDPGKESIYDWGYNNPSNSGGKEHCVHIFMRENVCLNDLSCDRVIGVEGDGIPMRGLCEIKRYQNCIVKTPF